MPLQVQGTPRRFVTMIGKSTLSMKDRKSRWTSSCWEAGSVDAAAKRAKMSVKAAVCRSRREARRLEKKNEATASVTIPKNRKFLT